MRKYLLLIIGVVTSILIIGCSSQSTSVDSSFENSPEIRQREATKILTNNNHLVDYEGMPLPMDSIGYEELDFSGDGLKDGVFYVSNQDNTLQYMYFLLNLGDAYKATVTSYPITVAKKIQSVEISENDTFLVITHNEKEFSVLKYVNETMFKLHEFENNESHWTNTDLGTYVTQESVLDASDYSNVKTQVIEYFVDNHDNMITVKEETLNYEYIPETSKESYIVKNDLTTYLNHKEVIEQILSKHVKDGLDKCPNITSETILEQALSYYIEHRFEFPMNQRQAYINNLIDFKNTIDILPDTYQKIDGKLQVYFEEDEGYTGSQIHQNIEAGHFENSIEIALIVNIENYEAYERINIDTEKMTRVFTNISLMDKFDIMINDYNQLFDSSYSLFNAVQFTDKEDTHKQLETTVYPTLVLNNIADFKEIPQNIWKATVIVPMENETNSQQMETFEALYKGNLEEILTYFNSNFDKFNVEEREVFAISLIKQLNAQFQEYAFGEAGIAEMIEFSTPPMAGGFPKSMDTLDALYDCYNFSTNEFNINVFDQEVKDKFLSLSKDPFYTVVVNVWASEGMIDLPMFNVVLDNNNLYKLSKAIEVCQANKDTLEGNLWVPEMPVYIEFESVDQVLNDKSMKYSEVWLHHLDELLLFEGADTWKVNLNLPVIMVDIQHSQDLKEPETIEASSYSAYDMTMFNEILGMTVKEFENSQWIEACETFEPEDGYKGYRMVSKIKGFDLYFYPSIDGLVIGKCEMVKTDVYNTLTVDEKFSFYGINFDMTEEEALNHMEPNNLHLEYFVGHMSLYN